jgi:hypothetical protein
MPVLGRTFYFPFSHSTRADALFSHLGNEVTDVEVEVYDGRGEQVLCRRFLDVPERGSITTRGDAKSDNLSRFVGANMVGLVSVQGARNALLTASALILGKGMTSCALLRPLSYAVGTQMHATVAIGDKFHLLLANPYAAEVQVTVEVAPSGEAYRPLQDPIGLGRNQVVLTEDAFALGKPSVVRICCDSGTPILAWGLGIGGNRTELYPLYG